MHTHTTVPPLRLLLLASMLAGCFVEPGYDPGGGTTGNDDTGQHGIDREESGSSGGADEADATGPAGEPDDGADLPGDDGGGTSPPPPDVPTVSCGNGDVDVGEECDDGNMLPGDGCNAACRIETTGCSGDIDAIAEDLDVGVAVCADPSQETCEEDFASLCAPGWHLCSAAEHQARAPGWSVDLGGHRALGVIRCRASGGAGHYTVSTMAAVTPDNCTVGSSRPACPSEFGCNETTDYALCCARIPTCGDGHVDAPLEECDDPRSPDCSAECANRTAQGPYC